MEKYPFDASTLKRWFDVRKRDLPWRHSVSPYRVWISEVMLQQTQVAVVIDYFERWMQRFPTVQSLAEASLDEVLKMWEGLGYYSRARHLHAAARQIVEEHRGEIPSRREELERVKGLGPYTIGALLSFGFHKRAAAVDGNVIRVLTRYFAITEPSDTPKVRKEIWTIAEEILPHVEPWLHVEGLIELGATVCVKKPRCPVCPLHTSCRAFHLGKQSVLPVKKKQRAITYLKRHVVVVQCAGEVLLKRVAKGQVMADLYEFPYFEESQDVSIPALFPFPLTFEKRLEEQTHTFTRYRAELFPSLWKAQEKRELPGYVWVAWEKMQQLPFSSGHRRIRDSL
jgi:A/G-specific adenine glycosylase